MALPPCLDVHSPPPPFPAFSPDGLILLFFYFIINTTCDFTATRRRFVFSKYVIFFNIFFTHTFVLCTFKWKKKKNRSTRRLYVGIPYVRRSPCVDLRLTVSSAAVGCCQWFFIEKKKTILHNFNTKRHTTVTRHEIIILIRWKSRPRRQQSTTNTTNNRIKDDNPTRVAIDNCNLFTGVFFLFSYRIAERVFQQVRRDNRSDGHERPDNPPIKVNFNK